MGQRAPGILEMSQGIASLLLSLDSIIFRNNLKENKQPVTKTHIYLSTFQFLKGTV